MTLLPKDIQDILAAAQQIVELRVKSKERTEQMVALAVEARQTKRSQQHRLRELAPVVDFGTAIDQLCAAMSKRRTP